MELTGLSIISSTRGRLGGAAFHGINPADGAALEPAYHSAAADEIDAAVRLAAQAFPQFCALPGKERGAFLRAIAAEIEALGAVLTARVMQETALPEPRVKGETARTCGQLRLFAALVEEGSWLDARIDHADPARAPLPKPDVRSMLCAIGPVVIFGASNFPLAYSVAGGDTASALAAGCPVIAKAHPAHPGTCELIGGAVQRAAAATGMPEGVFSLIFDAGHAAGMALVQHPLVCGAGFTGSRGGGRALMDAAAARAVPIPVYAEMSSINPVCLLPGALSERGAALAAGLHASSTMGAGQFCTNPGLVLVDRAADASAFRTELARLTAAASSANMLTAGICAAYQSGRARLAAHPSVKVLAEAASAGGQTATPAVYETTAAAFLADHALGEEVFGPCTLLVVCDGAAEMERVLASMEGQLTAAFHGTEADFAEAAPLIAAAQHRAGRIIFNGYGTGVEVCPAMVHGGPYPATSDGRSTSVGTAAILRWARAVCWQDAPDAALPPALRESNPLALRRLVDGSPLMPPAPRG